MNFLILFDRFAPYISPFSNFRFVPTPNALAVAYRSKSMPFLINGRLGIRLSIALRLVDRSRNASRKRISNFRDFLTVLRATGGIIVVNTGHSRHHMFCTPLARNNGFNWNSCQITTNNGLHACSDALGNKVHSLLAFRMLQELRLLNGKPNDCGCVRCSASRTPSVRVEVKGCHYITCLWHTSIDVFGRHIARQHIIDDLTAVVASSDTSCYYIPRWCLKLRLNIHNFPMFLCNTRFLFRRHRRLPKARVIVDARPGSRS